MTTNKFIKTGALALGVVALSMATAAGTYQWMSNRSAAHPGHDIALVDQHLNEYGFHNAALSPSYSPAAVGSAPDLVPAAEKAVQAVVHIRVEGRRNVSSQRMIDPFEYFFGGSPFGGRQSNQPVVGFGSGVIISDDGYIITNNHVVEDSEKISVTLNDNRTFNAKLIGTDPATDIALLKVDQKGLPTLPFGNSDNLKVGEWVLAVGNPFNFTSTVTSGIVSAKSRYTFSDNSKGPKIESFIQTDAAVNRGNSGGALVNAAGELVGINSMIFSETGNYAGISFAIPISMAAKVAGDIKQFGSVQRAVLGFTGGDLTDQLIKEKKLKVNEGVYVNDFTEISAVYAAGIEKGDVITAINGKSIRDFGELQGIISRYRPGDKVQVTVNRDGATKEFTVKLKNRQGNTKVLNEEAPTEEFGAKFAELSNQTKRSLGISYGVEVKEVSKNGKFDKAGIRKGFIILSVNDSPVYDLKTLNKYLRTIREQSRNGAVYLRGAYPNGEVYNYMIR